MTSRTSAEKKMYRLVGRFGEAQLPLDFADPMPYLEAILRGCEWNALHDRSRMVVMEPVEDSYCTATDSQNQLEEDTRQRTDAVIGNPKLYDRKKVEHQKKVDAQPIKLEKCRLMIV
jgi:hypothetical protein